MNREHACLLRTSPVIAFLATANAARCRQFYIDSMWRAGASRRAGVEQDSDAVARNAVCMCVHACEDRRNWLS